MIDTIFQKQILYEYIAASGVCGVIPGSFLSFIEANDGEQLWSRSNRTGHLTASAIIAGRDMDKFLLIYHKGLGKWLQPGGHIETPDDTLLAAAIREVEEETGLVNGDYDVMAARGGLYVADLDSHPIPCDPLKGEPGHLHHDVRFLFRLKHDGVPILTDPVESGGYQWTKPEDFPEYFNMEKLALRLRMYDRVFDVLGAEFRNNNRR